MIAEDRETMMMWPREETMHCGTSGLKRDHKAYENSFLFFRVFHSPSCVKAAVMKREEDIGRAW